MNKINYFYPGLPVSSNSLLPFSEMKIPRAENADIEVQLVAGVIFDIPDTSNIQYEVSLKDEPPFSVGNFINGYKNVLDDGNYATSIIFKFTLNDVNPNQTSTFKLKIFDSKGSFSDYMETTLLFF